MQKANQVLNPPEQQLVKPPVPKPTGLAKIKAVASVVRAKVDKKYEAFDVRTCIGRLQEQEAEDAITTAATTYANSEAGVAEAAKARQEANYLAAKAAEDEEEEAKRVAAEQEELQEDVTKTNQVVDDAKQDATLEMLAAKKNAETKLTQAVWSAKFRMIAAQGPAQDKEAGYAQITDIKLLQQVAMEKSQVVLDKGKGATLKMVAEEKEASKKAAKAVQSAEFERGKAQVIETGKVVKGYAGKAVKGSSDAAKHTRKVFKARKLEHCVRKFGKDELHRLAQDSQPATAEVKALLEAETGDKAAADAEQGDAAQA